MYEDFSIVVLMFYSWKKYL